MISTTIRRGSTRQKERRYLLKCIRRAAIRGAKQRLGGRRLTVQEMKSLMARINELWQQNLAQQWQAKVTSNQRGKVVVATVAQ